MKILTKTMVREYLKYIIPTVLTFVLTGVYSIVDGIFVGHAVGDAGLAGVNVAFPLVAVVLATGTGIGMSGGVISSIAHGAKEEDESQRAIGTTFVMLFLSSLPLMVILNVFAAPLCELLGGRGETLTQAATYLSVIALGVPFQVIVTGCIPLIRNRGKVAFAMFVQILAGFMNAFLDYVFIIVLGTGIAGAAAATVVSQIVAFVLIVSFFLRKDNRIAKKYLRLDLTIARHIVRLGAAPFGLTLVPEVTVVAINMNLAWFGNETDLAAYAAIAYAAFVLQILIQGVGDGSQPLVSRYWGASDYDKVRRIRNTNYLISVSLGALGLMGMILLRNQVPLAFGLSQEATAIVLVALPIFSIAYAFYGFTHASISYFYAIDDARASNGIVYGEAALVALVVTLLAVLFGVDGVWFSVVVVQVLLSAVILWLLRVRHKQRCSGLTVFPQKNKD